eukprot:3846722-Amphidinium_carterae.1
MLCSGMFRQVLHRGSAEGQAPESAESRPPRCDNAEMSCSAANSTPEKCACSRHARESWIVRRVDHCGSSTVAAAGDGRRVHVTCNEAECLILRNGQVAHTQRCLLLRHILHPLTASATARNTKPCDAHVGMRATPKAGEMGGLVARCVFLLLKMRLPTCENLNIAANPSHALAFTL